jgi:hypothetical protein
VLHDFMFVPAHALQAPLFSLFFSFSALGKIEVIILYSVGNVQSLLDARV